MKRALVVDVSPEVFRHLSALLGTRYALSFVERGSLTAALHASRAHAVVIDPVWASIDLPLIDSMLRRRSPVRVIAFLHATPEAIAAMVALAAAGLRHVILASTRDLGAAFDDALFSVEGDPIVEVIVDEIVGRVRGQPRFTAAIRDLFRRPHRFEGAADIARASETSITYVRRHLLQAGIMSPRRLFIVARVVNAYAQLREHGIAVQVVARRLGYSHPRVLNRHFQSVFGLKVGRARRTLTDEVALRHIRDWLWSSEPSGAPDSMLGRRSVIRSAHLRQASTAIA